MMVMQRMNLKKKLFVGLFLVVFGIPCFSQGVSVRNNLIWDATGTANVGIEIPVSNNWTIGTNAAIKTWPRFFVWDTGTLENPRQWKYLLVAPEVRYWPAKVYDGWFFGGDLIYSHYNAAKINPLGLFKSLKDQRHQGDYYGGGVFAGHSWWLSDHFRIEAEAGIGAGYKNAKTFECQHCGEPIGTSKGLQIVPKLGVNIAWNIESRRKAKKEVLDIIGQIEDIPEPPKERVRTPEIVVQKPVERQLTVVEQLAKTHPILHPSSEYQPYSKETVVRKMPGALYVFYELGKSEVKRNITTLSGPRDNGPVIDEILSLTEKILADSSSSISKIQIVGLSSFEGTRSRNIALSLERAHALKNFVQQHFNIPNDKFEVVGGGEAWTDLRDQLNDLLLAGGGAGLTVDELKKAIEIIDTEKDIAEREKKFKAAANGSIYDKVRRGIFADQRSAGYLRIYYDITEK